MIAYRCRTCADIIRTDDAGNRREYRELFLATPCDFCKLVIKESAEDKLLKAIFNEGDC